MDPDEPIQRGDPDAIDDAAQEARRDRVARAGVIALVVLGTAALLFLFVLFGGMSRT